MKNYQTKIAIFFTVLLVFCSCSYSVTIEQSKRYKVVEKIPQKNGYCMVYWFDDFKLRKNTIKCNSCYLGQKIGEGGLRF